MKVYVLKTNCDHNTGIGKVVGVTRHIYEANLHNNQDKNNEYQELVLND